MDEPVALDRCRASDGFLGFADLLIDARAACGGPGRPCTVTGQFADNSYSPDGSDRLIRRHRLEASDIAVSLRWTTAIVTKQPASRAAADPGESYAAAAGEANLRERKATWHFDPAYAVTWLNTIETLGYPLSEIEAQLRTYWSTPLDNEDDLLDSDSSEDHHPSED